jgi:hypothetical protein
LFGVSEPIVNLQLLLPRNRTFDGEEISSGGNLIKGLRFAIVVLSLATACFAQEGLTVHSKGKQKWPAAEAQKIYSSVCSVVQREFGANRSVVPQVTLVLGADKNEVEVGEQEIRLTKWDRYLFAQGVVIVAFEDLILDRRTALAKRALIWADAIAEIERIEK